MKSFQDHLVSTKTLNPELILKNNINISLVTSTLRNFYKKDKFVKILKSNSLLITNDVINTNYCNISICRSKSKSKIVIFQSYK